MLKSFVGSLKETVGRPTFMCKRLYQTSSRNFLLGGEGSHRKEPMRGNRNPLRSLERKVEMILINGTISFIKI